MHKKSERLDPQQRPPKAGEEARPGSLEESGDTLPLALAGPGSSSFSHTQALTAIHAIISLSSLIV